MAGTLTRAQADQRARRQTELAQQAPISVALATLEAVAKGIDDGSSLEKYYPELARLLHSKEPRAKVIASLMLTSDYTRIPQLLRVRAHLENDLIKSAYRGDLTPAEQIVFLSQFNQLIKEAEDKVQEGAQSADDLSTLVQKIDFATKDDAAELQKEFADTTPQGREVIRKLAFGLQRAVKAALEKSRAKEKRGHG